MSEFLLVSSDNGAENNYKDWIERYGYYANGGWRGGKRDLYEGGHRVPLFVRWPGVVAAGSRCDALVGQVYLFATLADILGVGLPDDQAEDSLGFRELLRGATVHRDALVHHSGAGHFGYRQGDWKLFSLPPTRGVQREFYDLAADPQEQHDLAARHPDVVRRLTTELTEVVQRGRSRPGAPAANDGKAWWPQLNWIQGLR